MDVFSHEVLLMGGAAVGLRAAIVAFEMHPTLSIAVISKAYQVNTHAVSDKSGAAAVVKSDDSHEHSCDTISDAIRLCGGYVSKTTLQGYMA